MSNVDANVFDALDAAEETPRKEAKRESIIYHVPVNLHIDEESGEEYFYVEKDSFPNHSITSLNILYTQAEKEQMTEQVLANNTCPEVVLKNVQIEFGLSGGGNINSGKEYLNNESFRLSGSKIGAIRMRMYSKNKDEAIKQLESASDSLENNEGGPAPTIVKLNLDLECQLVGREAPKQ